MSNVATLTAQKFVVKSSHPVYGERVVIELASEAGARAKVRRLTSLAGKLNAETTYDVVPA